MDKGSFIQMIFEIAAEGYADFGILPSLAISQGILESDWGKKHIENNIYGIKAGKSWTGKVALRNTREWDGRKVCSKTRKI
jgi:flagellum-specific peptidoglycan hydrolase FlgJ